MKIADIVNQLKAVLPRYTTDFSNVLRVSLLSRSGSIVTATTATPHGLNNYKGVFANPAALNSAFPTAVTNDFAYVTSTATQWLWNGTIWINTGANNISVMVLVQGALTPLSVTSLTQVNGFAAALCAVKHNLTKANTSVQIAGANDALYNDNHDLIWDAPGFQIASIVLDTITNVATVSTVDDNNFISNPNFEIEIFGTAQSAYNRKTSIASIIDSKTFTIANVYGANEDGTSGFGKVWQVKQFLNAYTFIFKVDPAAVTPATGSIFQVYEYQTGYNGYKAVLSAPTPTTFTYAIDTAPLSPAQGSISANISSNITGSESLERAMDFYETEYAANNSTQWAIVTVSPKEFNKSNFNSTDSKTYNAFGDIIREMYYQDATVYLFLPSGSKSDQLLYIATADKADGYFPPICHCLLGLSLPSGLSEASFSRLSPSSAGRVDFKGAYYIYQITFQATNYINEGDAIQPEDLSKFHTFDFAIPSNTDPLVNTMNIRGNVDEDV